MKIPLAIGRYLTNCERAINLYAVVRIDAVSGKPYIAFLNTEGLELLSSISAQPVRGLYVASKDPTKLYAVLGGKFYLVIADGTFTEKGSLLTSVGPVEISDNGDDGTSGTGIFLSDGTYGYTYQPTTNTFAQVTDPDFPGARSNCFLDGITLVVKPNSGQIWGSNLYEFLAWTAIDFSTAESDPDDLMRCLVTPTGVLVLMGKTSTEFWSNNAAPTALTFERIQGARFGYGLAAHHSFAWNDQAGFFLARTTMSQGEKFIVRLDGFQPTVVSPDDLNRELAKMTNTEDAEGFAYTRDGHAFYQLTFPTDKRTFVLNASTGFFHEKSSTVGGVDTRHRARCYAYFNGWHVVGDYSTGNIYKLKKDVYAENGTTVKRKLVTPTLTDRSKNGLIEIPELRIPMKTGVGLDGAGQGTDPMLMLRYSKDRGKTWSNETLHSIGKIGEYDKKVARKRMGQAKQWNIELSFSDPVEIDIDGPLMVTTE